MPNFLLDKPIHQPTNPRPHPPPTAQRICRQQVRCSRPRRYVAHVVGLRVRLGTSSPNPCPLIKLIHFFARVFLVPVPPHCPKLDTSVPSPHPPCISATQRSLSIQVPNDPLSPLACRDWYDELQELKGGRGKEGPGTEGWAGSQKGHDDHPSTHPSTHPLTAHEDAASVFWGMGGGAVA